MWDGKKDFNNTESIPGRPSNSKKTDAMIKELKELPWVHDDADDATIRQYLYEKYHYHTRNVQLNDRQKQIKRRKSRLDKVDTTLMV